jgi:hypothetical protein
VSLSGLLRDGVALRPRRPRDVTKRAHDPRPSMSWRSRLSTDNAGFDSTPGRASGPDPGHGGWVLGTLITVAGLLLAAAHTVWPDLQVDVITLGLLLLAITPWLGRIFQSVEFPGGWKLTYRELQRRVEEGQQQVDRLADRVERVEQFVFSGGTPQQQGALDRALVDFDRYMKSLGYRDDRPLPKILVGSSGNAHDLPYWVDKEYGSYYFWHQHQRLIFVGSAVAGDLDRVQREYCNHMLQGLMPQNPEGGGWQRTDPDMVHGSTSIQSALADYFPCSLKSDPCFGRASAQALKRSSRESNGECLRSLNNDRDVASLGTQPTPEEAGEIWAGAFWQLRSTLGAARVDSALLKACRWVVPWPERASLFVDRLIDDLSSSGAGSDVRAVFTQRGLLA